MRPEFLRLNAAPEAGSFQALRQAVPPSAVVYLSPTIRTLDIHRPEIGAEYSLQAASSLSHARLFGVIDQIETASARTLGRSSRLASKVPDLVVMPATFVPWMFPPAGRQPIWWNDEDRRLCAGRRRGADHAAAAGRLGRSRCPSACGRPTCTPPMGASPFTTTLNDQAPEQWAGQDWVLIAADTSPWALPLTLRPDGLTPVADAWFAGQAASGAGTTTHTYEFDARAARLAVQDGHGVFTAAASGGSVQGSGVWTLGIRLQHEWRPNYRRDAAFIPVLQIRVSEAGEVSYEVYDDPLTVRPLP